MQKKTIRLTNCFKNYTQDLDKACSPEETVKHFWERLKKENLDVLKEVKRIDNGRLEIPVYFSVCGKDAEKIVGTKKQMGKGSTPEQAQASACMELAERFSFFSFMQDTDHFFTESYTRIKKKGYPLLPLEKMLQSVHDQTTSPKILEQLLTDIPMQWVWATNLNNQEEILIPFSWFYAINEFNGSSAGNTLEEAISQGLCEVVERHVSAVVCHDKLETPAIDKDSLRDPMAIALLEKFKNCNIELYLNDFTLDTGIPTVAALAIDRATFPESSEIVFTAGTTPHPEKSIIRAITEVAQLAGDFNSQSNYIASGLPKPLSMTDAEYVTGGKSSIPVTEMVDISSDNIREEIENCVTALAKLGLEVYVVDVTHPRLKIPAVYVFVPGVHFRERSRIHNVGLFAAKLVTERVADPALSNEYLRRMKKVLPQAYYIEFYLGKNLISLGALEEALEHLRRALELHPEEEDLPYIYSYMGDCLKNLGLFAEALVVLKKGLAVDEERHDIHNIMGVCNFKLEEYETAISHFERAVELLPSSAIDYANLAVNYRKLEKNKEAIHFFQLALALDPEIIFARDQLDELLNP
ncbi:MAG: YcaO-like family protein [Thermodesulfobacteriota bacterium]|nr:YcaO-like family protein [Thermodesulfobacteriota bacterium]